MSHTARIEYVDAKGCQVTCSCGYRAMAELLTSAERFAVEHFDVAGVVGTVKVARRRHGEPYPVAAKGGLA